MLLNVMGGTLVCMTMAVMSPIHMIGTVFMREQLGASRTLVGLNVTLWIGAIVFALPGAYVFNRLMRRRPMWVVLMVAGRMFLFLVAVAAFLSARAELRPKLVVLVLLANVLCVSLTAFTSSAFWSWMAELIPESVRGRFFGRRYQVHLIATAVAGVLGSLLLERVDVGLHLLYFALFLAGATLGVLDPILFWGVPELRRSPRPKRTFRETIAVYFRPLRDRNFAYLAWTQGFNTLLVSMALPFLVLYQRGEHVGDTYIGCGISLQFLAIMQVIHLVSTALVATQWGRLADRIGHRTVYILGRLFVFTTVFYFFMGPENYWYLLPIQLVLQSILMSGVPVAMQNLMIGNAPDDEREYYVSTFHAVIAAAGALGPWMGGMLADAMPVVAIELPHGQPACYLHILLVAQYAGTLLNLPLMTRIQDVRGERLLPWFARMLSGGLFRTMWNIGAITDSASPSRRARALRGVRHQDGNVVLNDVAEALEDPDPGVRREALLALGRIGTPEAIELLMWQLHEPDRETRTVSAEALGETKRQEGTMPLVHALHDADGEVRRAAARALGNLADQRASDQLLDLLNSEEDAEVLVGVSSALSRIREFRACRQMLHMALKNRNRMVRLHIIVAMGDLLGPPGKFYRRWRQEQSVAGITSARLGRRLRAQAKALLRLRGRPLPAPMRRDLLRSLDRELTRYVEASQSQEWTEALLALRALSIRFLELRYDYKGDEQHALQFITAIDPHQAERYWLIDFLLHAHASDVNPEAPWDGLTLLACWALVHGQPPT